MPTADIPAEGVAAAGADDPERRGRSDARGDRRSGPRRPRRRARSHRGRSAAAIRAAVPRRCAVGHRRGRSQLVDRRPDVLGRGLGRVDAPSTSTTFTFTVEMPEGGGEVVVTYADRCLTVTFDGDETKTCGIGEGDLGDLTDELDLGDDEAITDVIDAFTACVRRLRPQRPRRARGRRRVVRQPAVDARSTR